MSSTVTTRKKSDKRKRGHFVGIRFDDSEFAQLQERASAAGYATVQDYIRARSIGAKPARARLDVKLLVKVEMAINRIGSNVNQIAAVANTRDTVTPQQIDDVEKLLLQVHREVASLYPQR